MRHLALALAGLFFAFAPAAPAPAAATDAPERVGEYSTLDRIEIRGIAAFSPAEVKRGIVKCPDFWIASHPAAPLVSYLSFLRRAVRDGLLHEGFPAATADAAFDAESRRIVVTATPGRRLRCGEPVVTGSPLPAGKIADLLADEEHSYWKPGEPAPFDVVTRDRIARAVRGACREAGYLFPKVQVRVDAPEEGDEARLSIAFAECGPAAVLGALRIEGNVRSSDAAIAECAGVAPGDRLNTAALDGMKRRLDASGRFLSVDASPVVPDEPSAAVDVRLVLKENAAAPPLGEALDGTQRLLLSVGRKIEGLEESGGVLDYRFDVDAGAVRLVFAPGQGCAIFVAPAPDAPPDYGFVFQPDHTVLFSRPGNARLTLPARGRILLKLSFEPDGDRTKVSLSAGLTDEVPPGTKRVDTDLRISPAALLIQAAKLADARVTREAGGVRFEKDDVRIEIDESTGDLRELAVRAEGTGLRTIRRDAGTFGDVLSRSLAGSEALPEWFEPDHPVSSSAAFFVALASQGAWNDVFDAEALRPLDEVVARLDPGDESGFSVPLPVDEGRSTLPCLAPLLVPPLQQIFAVDSWPVRLTRELLLVVSGGSPYTSDTLQGILVESPGPIGHLVTAELLTLADGDLARRAARVSLEGMDAKGFLAEAASVFLREGSASREILDSVTERIRGLSEEQLAALVARLPEEDRVWFGNVAAALRAEEPRLQVALLVLWRECLEPAIRAELERLAGGDR